MKRCVAATMMLQVVNAIMASFGHKPMIAFLFSVPVSLALAWIVGRSLADGRIFTRHHGVIERNNQPVLYWLIVMLKVVLLGITLYFPWGTTMRC